MNIRHDLYFTYLRTGPEGKVEASMVRGEPPHELLAAERPNTSEARFRKVG